MGCTERIALMRNGNRCIQHWQEHDNIETVLGIERNPTIIGRSIGTVPRVNSHAIGCETFRTGVDLSTHRRPREQRP